MRKPRKYLVIDGVDVFEEYRAALGDEMGLGCPAPKTHVVEVPGGEDIDLTDALSGDTAYSNRSQEFHLLFFGPDFWWDYRRFKNRFHGRAADYRICGVDEATYHGRFSVSEKSALRGRGLATLSVDASPWRRMPPRSLTVAAGGGAAVHLPSGRCPVQPVFTCARECELTMGGASVTVQRGKWASSNVWLHQGDNVVYVNSAPDKGGDRPLSDLGTVVACGGATVADLSWKRKPTGDEYLVGIDYEWKDL